MILHKVVDSCTIRVWSDNICDWRDLPLKLHLREHEYTAKPVLQDLGRNFDLPCLPINFKLLSGGRSKEGTTRRVVCKRSGN